MAQYVKVNPPVEARQHEGPRLNVVSDAKGQQVAEKGDWLVGSERGKITVVSNADFTSGYVPYSPTAADDELAKAKSDLAASNASNADLGTQVASLEKQVADLSAKNSALSGAQSDADQAKAQVASLTKQLADATLATTQLQTRFDALSASVKSEADAQAAAQAAQASAAKQVGK